MTLDVQNIVNAVMDHVGGDRFQYDAKKNTKVNSGTSRGHTYQHLTNGTRDALRGIFREDVRLLERLVGKKFSWSSWANDNDGANDDGMSDWLVTTPNSLDKESS